MTMTLATISSSGPIDLRLTTPTTMARMSNEIQRLSDDKTEHQHTDNYSARL